MNLSNEQTTSSSSVSAKGQKKRLRRDKWEKNRRKRKRASGKGYVTKKNNKEISAKKFVFVTSCCSKNCHQKANLSDQKEMFDKFYNLEDKQKQDDFLMSCTVKAEIKYFRQNIKTKHRNFSWKYFLNRNGKKDEVCKGYLEKLYQITDGRMKTIQRFHRQGLLLFI